MAALTVEVRIARIGRTFTLYLHEKQCASLDITEIMALEEQDVPRAVALLDTFERRATGMRVSAGEASSC